MSGVLCVKAGIVVTFLHRKISLSFFSVNFYDYFSFVAIIRIFEIRHCVNSVQIRSYFWSVFSCIQSKYRKPVTTPYLDTFHAVIIDLLKTNPIRKEYNTIETLTIATTRKLKTYTFFL